MNPNDASRDQQDLKRFGYAQELFRDMGGFSNFAISFSNISILTGAVTLFGYGFTQGGPLEMSLAWPLATVMTLAVAVSMAEMCSAIPTSGAVYHWSAELGNPVLAWFVAWLNILGCTASFAAINYSCAQYLLPLMRIETSTMNLFVAFVVITLMHGFLNSYGVKWVAWLNDASVTVHILGTLILVAGVFFFAPLQPVVYLMKGTSAKGFVLGLLQAMWTYTGYDASAHLAEETQDARKHAPWGIVLSVAISGVIGYLLLIALTLAVQKESADMTAVSVLQSALGERMGSALSAMAGIAMWFCGLSALANNSRGIFALARDHGTPFSSKLAHVDPKHGTPVAAIWSMAAVAIGLLVWSGTLPVLTALATSAMYLSYGVPLWLGVRHPGREWVKEAPWNLGRHGAWINWIAVVWVAFVSVVLLLPPNELAAYTLAGALAGLGLVYTMVARKGYRGPGFARHPH